MAVDATPVSGKNEPYVHLGMVCDDFHNITHKTTLSILYATCAPSVLRGGSVATQEISVSSCTESTDRPNTLKRVNEAPMEPCKRSKTFDVDTDVRVTAVEQCAATLEKRLATLEERLVAVEERVSVSVFRKLSSIACGVAGGLLGIWVPIGVMIAWNDA